jgi:hypothetical protein
MLAEAFQIDLAPVSRGIGVEHPDDLGDGPEGVLPRHRGRPGRGRPMLHAVHRVVGHGHLALVHRLMLHRLVLHGRILGKDSVRHEPRTECDAERDQNRSPHGLLLTGKLSRMEYAEREVSKSMI